MAAARNEKRAPKMISMQFAPHKSRNVSQVHGQKEVWLGKIATAGQEMAGELMLQQ